MKKVWISLLPMVGILLFAGCNEPVTADEMQKFRDGYAQTEAAVTVTQNIEVLRGKLAVYVYEKEYEKTETGYEMTYTEKRLNQVTAETEEAYTVTTETATVAAAETFNPTLELDLGDFQSGYEILDASFRGQLREGKEDEVFGLTKSHAEMKDVALSLTLGGERLQSLTVNFLSGDYSVSIELTFTYSAAA